MGKIKGAAKKKPGQSVRERHWDATWGEAGANDAYCWASQTILEFEKHLPDSLNGSWNPEDWDDKQLRLVHEANAALAVQVVRRLRDRDADWFADVAKFLREHATSGGGVVPIDPPAAMVTAWILEAKERGDPMPTCGAVMKRLAQHRRSAPEHLKGRFRCSDRKIQMLIAQFGESRK